LTKKKKRGSRYRNMERLETMNLHFEVAIEEAEIGRRSIRCSIRKIETKMKNI
jgi:hypothetical protein